jgi:HEAT repeat protein
MWPHTELRERQDRSYTGPLLEALAREPDDEVVSSLEILEDPRAQGPLLQILQDRDAAGPTRRAAGAILRSGGHGTDSATLRRWWAQGDEVLQQHALLEMGPECADIVESIASDPSHPLHRDSIATMQFGFEAPRSQALKVAALSHPDPAVRQTAADALLWDEPAAAEQPLLRCARDPVPEVAIAALDTLRYYPTLGVLVRLEEIVRESAAGEVHEQARSALLQLLDDVWLALRASRGPARDRLRAWFAPVLSWLAPLEDEQDERPPMAQPPRQPSAFPSADELVARYSSLDGPWRERWDELPTDGAAAPPADRPRLARWVLDHPDPQLRSRGAAWLVGWGDRDALLGLFRDHSFSVRKTATYQLGRLPPEPSLAPVLWEHLLAPSTASTHAYETLNAWVRHAPRSEALQRLPSLVLHDERESVRYHAVHSLIQLGERDALTPLLALLVEPPRVTWGVHLVLLEGARKLGLPVPELVQQALARVDHLQVQQEVARMSAATSDRSSPS